MTDNPADEIVGQHASIRREYRDQAASWGRRPISADLTWVVEQVPWQADWRVLDVAGGTGLFARAIAACVGSVVVVDLTAEMLEQGKAQVQASKISNVEFEQGAAEQLPFPDGSFDAVVTRYTIHHFRHPVMALREMARVCRPGGQLVVVDMVADDDSVIAERHNGLERLADTTHTTILSPRRLISEIVDAGFSLETYLSREVEKVFNNWQPQLAIDSAERQTIRDALTRELRGEGDPTGLRPILRGDVLAFRHTWGIVVARRRLAPAHIQR